MDIRNRRHQTNLYTKEQIKRVVTGSGITIESEVDSDYIIFCPFHNNNRTPAGEIDKNNGTFFCFSCHHIADLVEFVWLDGLERLCARRVFAQPATRLCAGGQSFGFGQPSHYLAAYFAQIGRKEDPKCAGQKVGGSAVEGAVPLVEIVEDLSGGEIKHDRTSQVAQPKFPYAVAGSDAQPVPRREQLANWLTSKENQYFAKSFVQDSRQENRCLLIFNYFSLY